MAREDRMVEQWFDVLSVMQRCAANLNHNTQSDLPLFYSQKQSEVLGDEDLQQSFASCVFAKTAANTGTGLSVTADDFAHTSDFRELLDAAFRPLRISIRALFKNEGVNDRTVPPDMDPMAFESMATTDVYRTDAARQALISRLSSLMPTLTDGRQADLTSFLAKKNTTAGRAIDSIL